MKRIYSRYKMLKLLIIIGIVLASASWPPAWAKKLNIVTTTTDLASIARSIAGGHADVTSIAGGKEDPHFLQARPSYMVAARQADLWIRVGMELEVGWEPPILDGAYNPSIRQGAPGHLDASEKVLKLDVPTTRLSRAMGDVHPEGNPHYWLDPLNGRIVAKSIAEHLCLVAPEYSQDFMNNLKTFQGLIDEKMFGKPLVEKVGGTQLWTLDLKGKLDEVISVGGSQSLPGGWMGSMLPLRESKIVTYHKSWIYFANRFGLDIVTELEPKPGIPPSSSHLAKVIEQVKAQNVKVILVEPFYSRKSADFVASKTGAQVVVCPISVGGAPEAVDYTSLINLIVTRVSGALKP